MWPGGRRWSGTLALGAAGWLVLGSAANGQAQSAQPIVVRVPSGACPDAVALTAQLQPLLPDARVFEEPLDAPDTPDTPGADPGADAGAEVRDLGVEYEVALGEIERRWSDPARDCTERARVVAVFLALNLAPPASKPKPEPQPEPTPPEPSRWSLQLFGSLAHAPSDAATGFGGGLGGALTLGAWQLTLAASALSPAELTLDRTATTAGSVEMIRLSLDLSISYLWRAGPFVAGPELGFVLDLQRMQGVDLNRAQTDLRLNPGVRAGARLQLDLDARWYLLLLPAVEIFPRQYALVVSPAGEQGQTPLLWLRADLGVGLRLP